jgi:hypothetical protein
MTYKFILKDGTVIDNIPNNTTFVDAKARVKKGFPNLADEDFPQNYQISLPNGKLVEFPSSVSIPEAHVILSRQYSSFSVYDERGSEEKAIDNLVLVSASFFVCLSIAVFFYMKFRKIKDDSHHLQSTWWSGWTALVTLLVSLIGAFNSHPKLIYYPKFWDLQLASQTLVAPIVAFVLIYLISRLILKLKNNSTATEVHYALAAKEIESGNIDRGLWARIYSEKNGDDLKTRASYIKERAKRFSTNS